MIQEILNEFQTSKNSKIRKLKTLYALILKHGPIRAETLAERANMKPATCARLLDELGRLALISTSKRGESTGGRKPILYNINANKGFLFGVEITALYSTILLLNMALTVCGRIKIRTPTIQNMDEIIEQIIPQMMALLHKHRLTNDNILGIGIAIDDLFEQKGTTQAEIAMKINEIKRKINQKISTYITVDCGVNFAALAEHRLHYANVSRCFLFTSCDIEIRSCILMGDTLPLTHAGSANALGHVTVDINGPQCPCGAFGCLHSYSSLAAIKNKILLQLKQGRTSPMLTSMTSIKQIDYHTILTALENKDEIASEALEDAAYYYGIALANMVLTLQPDVVVCGGTLVPKGSFFDVVKRTAENKLTIYPHIKTAIYPVSDSYDIVSIGAGGMVLAHFLS